MKNKAKLRPIHNQKLLSFEWMNEWINEWTIEQMNEWMNEQINELINAQMNDWEVNGKQNRINFSKPYLSVLLVREIKQIT